MFNISKFRRRRSHRRMHRNWFSTRFTQQLILIITIVIPFHHDLFEKPRTRRRWNSHIRIWKKRIWLKNRVTKGLKNCDECNLWIWWCSGFSGKMTRKNRKLFLILFFFLLSAVKKSEKARRLFRNFICDYNLFILGYFGHTTN